MSEPITYIEPPTLEGRALLDLGRQLAAMRAERDALKAAVKRVIQAGHDTDSGQAAAGPALYGCECEWCEAYRALVAAAQ